MIYTFSVHKRVEQFLEKHPQVAKKFVTSMKELCKNPFSNACDIKALKGENNIYRLRIGKYRFLYFIFQEEIHIYVSNADSLGSTY